MNPFQPKITEIQITISRPEFVKDAAGKRVRKQVMVKAFRPIEIIGAGSRFLHYFIDIIIVRAIELGITAMLTSFVPAVMSPNDLEFSVTFFFFTPVYLIVLLGYYILFEFFFQKTPGKFITRCRVIDEFGNRPDGGVLFLRTLIRVVPFEAFSCMSDRGWHDKWSKTWVVPDREYFALRELLAKQEQTPANPAARMM